MTLNSLKLIPISLRKKPPMLVVLHNRKKFLAYARNNSCKAFVISNEVRDLSPNCSTTRTFYIMVRRV
jgi:hypothetical protein